MGIQIQELVKDRQGNPLSILNKQFISFSYGGKNIEDFDLIAVFDDRLNKNIYSDFEDVVSENSEVDGQLYWKTKINPNELSFTLATDGMSSKQLEEFKLWFSPGIERELILAEHSNRAIMARVSEPPNISVIPFKDEREIKIGGKTKKVITSLYKGEIELNFIMDNPFWYSKKSYIDSSVLNDIDIKIIYEDSIPHISMLKTPCFLANNIYFNGTSFSTNSGQSLSGKTQNDKYLYYCGTAKSAPKISFSINAIFKNNLLEFPIINTNDNYYIKIGTKYLYFSLPDVLLAYNSAISIVKDFSGTSILDLRAKIRDEVFNYYSRAFAIKIIDYARSDTSRTYVSVDGEILPSFKDYFYAEMQKLFADSLNFTFSIDSSNGEVKVSYTVSSYDSSSTTLIIENSGNMIKSKYLFIDERTFPDREGTISSSNCLSVITNTEINNLLIEYKYMYL